MSRSATWLTLLALGAGAAALAAWRAHWLREAPLLPVAFEHADHRTVGCRDCHHNFVDDTGDGLCYDCHKRDAALAVRIERDFHGLCRGCHLELAAAGAAHGPLRRCGVCHDR